MLPTDKSQLDPAVLNLVKGIRQVESGSNYQAQGKSGEYGAYQYTPSTWKQWAGKYLGDQNADITDPANQNKVAYARVLELKNQGLKPAEVVSMWNSGKRDPTGNVGVNKFGVAYDTPAYVAKVLGEAQKYATPKDGGSIGNIPTAQAATEQPEPKSEGDWLSKTAGFVSSIFPGKQVGEAIGTLGGYLYTKAYDSIHGTDYAKNYDLSAPTPGQVAADVAQGALLVGSGMPEGTATSVFGKAIPALSTPVGMVGRVAQNTALGAGFGLTGALATGGNIKSQTELGAVIGGAAGVGGELAAKAFTSLPDWLTKRALPKLEQQGTIDYAAANAKGFTIKSMVANSEKAMASYERQVDGIIKHPIYADVTIGGDEIMAGVMKAFPRSEYELGAVMKKMKTLVPAEASTISRLESGATLTLDEANTLRQALDKVSYKVSVFDPPEVRAGKELAAAVGDAIRTQVQTKAPETKPIFAKWSKEITLSKALKSAAKKDSGKHWSISDLVFLVGGHSAGGIPGALAAEATKKALQSPANKLNAAKILRKTAPLGLGVGEVAKRAATLTPGRITNQGAQR